MDSASAASGAYKYDAQEQQLQQQPTQPTMQLALPPAPQLWTLPPSLQYLTSVDQILIKQQKEMLEILTGWETENKYVVLNTVGQQMFFAMEHSRAIDRMCLGNARPFEMTVVDNTGQETIHIHRPYKCKVFAPCYSCSKCCLDEVTVEAPPGRVVGVVRQLFDCCNANYAIEDSHGSTVLLIKGPRYFRCNCPGDDIPFKLLTKDGSNEIGRISKQWSNLMQEYFTDADNFGISFPMDLHLDVKTTIIGACFLIDFMYFERNRNR